MFLCIGPTSSGKTSLINRLAESSSKNDSLDCELPATAPTVGTNLTTIYPTSSSSSSSKKNKSSGIVVREVGGTMTPIWPNYFSECRGLLFVANVSDPRQVAATGVLLLATLAHEHLVGKPTVVVFNKSDLVLSPAAVAANFKFLLRLDDVMCHCSQNVTVVDSSAKSGAGIYQLKQWLSNYSK